MPFCRNCGGEVSESMKFCPHCASSQDSELASATISDSVISGDVSVKSTVNINSRSKKKEIENFVELAILKLANGDMASAKDIFTEAKKIDVTMTMMMLEDKVVEIGKCYVDIAEECYAAIAATNVTLDSRAIGTNVIITIEGDHQISSLYTRQSIAISNAREYLGTLSEIGNWSDGEAIEPERIYQLYRCRLILEATGYIVFKKTNHASPRIEGVSKKNLDNFRETVMNACQDWLLWDAVILSLIEKLEWDCLDKWQEHNSALIKIIDNMQRGGADDVMEDWSHEIGEVRKFRKKIQKSQGNFTGIMILFGIIVMMMMIAGGQ